MRFSFRVMWLSCLFAMVAVLSAARSAPRQHDAKAHRHPESEKLTNPAAGDAESIAAGAKFYDRYCSECHGDTGRGDGMAGEGLEPPPADLTDAKWKHGSRDGEIFTVVRDGTSAGMKSFKKKLTERQIWDVVNYVRTLGPKPAKSH